MIRAKGQELCPNRARLPLHFGHEHVHADLFLLVACLLQHCCSYYALPSAIAPFCCPVCSFSCPCTLLLIGPGARLTAKVFEPCWHKMSASCPLCVRRSTEMPGTFHSLFCEKFPVGHGNGQAQPWQCQPSSASRLTLVVTLTMGIAAALHFISLPAWQEAAIPFGRR